MGEFRLVNLAFRRFAWVAGVFLLLLVSVPVWAQSTGTILGTVKDSSGAVVPQASVTVVNVDTNDTRTQVTGDDGAFRFPALTTGHYSVKIEKSGFSTQTQTGLTLEVTQELVLNPALQVGTSTQEVTVTGEAPLVNTTNSSLGGLVNEEKIADLPLNGRNYTDLTFMQPGVNVSTNVGNSGPQGGVRGTFFSSDGGPIRSNMMTLDGAILLNGRGGTAASESGTTLGVSGIKEFKVVTGIFSAEYGISPAAQVVMVSKGGTNQFHGEVFEYIRNSVLDAANFFDKPLASNNFQRLPPFKRNNFGASFGGPIRKDKTFVFAAYEAVRQRFGQTLVDTVPNVNCHSSTPGQLVWNGQGTAPPNSVGPCTQLGSNPGGPNTNSVAISSVMVPILALYPLPNLPSNQVSLPSTSPSQVDWGQARIDQNISASDTLFGRYSTDKSFLISANTQVAGAGGAGFPELFLASYASYDQFVTLSENHIFSPTILNTFRFSYSRTNWSEGNVYPNGPAALTGPSYSFVSGFPMGSIAVTGLSQLGPNANNPQGGIQNIYSLYDDVFYTKGKHALKFGTQINKWNTGVGSMKSVQGLITFTSFPTFLTGKPATYTALQGGRNANGSSNYMYWQMGFYAQDDWHILPRLTLNLGVRYEFMTVPTDTDGVQGSLRNKATDTAFTPGPIVAPFGKLHFSPRVGFAWDIQGNGKTSLRGGFGQYWDIGNLASILFGSRQGEPPYNGLLTHATATSDPAITLPLTFSGSEPISIQTVDYNLFNPYLLKWNLTLERQLPLSMGLQIAYVGTKGVHLYYNEEGNPVLPTAVVNGYPYWNGLETRRNTHFGSSMDFGTGAESHYNGLQVALNKRASHGVEFQLSYTYSKALDTAQSSFAGVDCNGASGMNTAVYFGPGFQTFTEGPSCWDTTHNVRVNVLYHIPNVKSDNIIAKFEHGWWVGGIFSAQTGYPFTPVLGGNRSQSKILNTSPDYPNLGTATVAPGATGPNGNVNTTTATFIPYDPNTVILGDPAKWFNPLMFTLTPEVTTSGGTTVCTTSTCSTSGNGAATPRAFSTIGNVPRGLLRGPGLKNLDFSVNKDTALPFLGEQGKLAFRAEFFNILNHPNFGMPLANGAVFTGTATDFGAYSELPGSNAGVISQTVNTSRQIQLALKFIF